MPAGEAQAGPVLTASEGGRMMQALSKMIVDDDVYYYNQRSATSPGPAVTSESVRPLRRRVDP